MSKIFIINNKKEKSVLRTKIPPTDLSKENKKELREFVRQMRITMKAALGIGLSANQIGFTLRLFVAQVPRSSDDASNEKFYAIFNPKIIRTYKEKTLLEEGCLSVPGYHGMVERSERIVLEGYNIQGKKIKIKAWGLLARVFQHEVDHLDGKLFIDKAKEVYEIDEQNLKVQRRGV
ncbi:MAG: peptide deformylase [Patescibacteria group bacterium]|nr:peptide deformylase [Patescibacteria group bacterium]